MSLASIGGWSLAALAGALVLSFAYGAGYSAWTARRWPAEGRFVETDAGPIHVVESGPRNGPVVVLVHGASANNRELRSTLEAPLAAAGFRVVALDRPGFGGTPALDDADRLGGHARAIAALIEAEGFDRPIVVAHSYGGAVSLRLALDRPGLAGGYVLLGPATHGDVGPVAWYNDAAAIPVVGWVLTRCVAPIAGPIAAKPGLANAFAPQPVPDGHGEATGVGLVFRPETFAENTRDLHEVNAELRAQQDRYGEIADPVSIIAGEDDRTLITPRHSGRTAAAIAGARLTLLPGVGHMPHHAVPGLIVEEVARLQSEKDAPEARAVAAGASP